MTLKLTEIQIPTPLGRFIATMCEADVLRAACFVDGDVAAPVYSEGAGAAELRARLAAYFEGEVTAVQGLPIAHGGTAFQAQVWDALRRSPPGETMSYGALAVRLGLQGYRAARAVGAANAANPIALLIPCHRVIATDGRLLGYAWGVERKRWLLQHEADHATPGAAQGSLL